MLTFCPTDAPTAVPLNCKNVLPCSGSIPPTALAYVQAFSDPPCASSHHPVGAPHVSGEFANDASTKRLLYAPLLMPDVVKLGREPTFVPVGPRAIRL